jgi:hypothetical protein
MTVKRLIAAGFVLALSAPAGAQLPGIDAPTGAGIGSDMSRKPNADAPGGPATAAPGDATSSTTRSNGVTRNPSGRVGVGGSASTESKVEGSGPIVGGVGSSGTGATIDDSAKGGTGASVKGSGGAAGSATGR